MRPVNLAIAIKTEAFADDEEVRALVCAFEEASILPSRFPHRAHIAVALSYLESDGPEEALRRMRQSLLHFSRRHGVDVYHETITRFWMKLLDHLAATHYRDLPLWRRINLIAERWTVADPIEAHYSRAVIRSRAARQSWVAPDRLPIPF